MISQILILFRWEVINCRWTSIQSQRIPITRCASFAYIFELFWELVWLHLDEMQLKKNEITIGKGVLLGEIYEKINEVGEKRLY